MNVARFAVIIGKDVEGGDAVVRFGSMNAALSTEEEKRVEMTYTRHGNSTIMQKAYMQRSVENRES